MKFENSKGFMLDSLLFAAVQHKTLIMLADHTESLLFKKKLLANISEKTNLSQIIEKTKYILF